MTDFAAQVSEFKLTNKSLAEVVQAEFASGLAVWLKRAGRDD